MQHIYDNIEATTDQIAYNFIGKGCPYRADQRKVSHSSGIEYGEYSVLNESDNMV